jgi:glycosyltransferase involved in cell wall biosynthesis
LPSLVPRDRGVFPRLLAAYPQTRAILKDCDLIHCCVEPFVPLAALVAGKRPFFQAGVGSYLHNSAWQRPPLTTIYRRAIERSTIVCISNYTAKVARAEFPNTPVEVVTLGIDPTRFEHLPPLAEPKRGKIILTAGGIKHRKGTLPLVKAMAVVREQIPDVRCIILGNTADQSSYTQQVRAAISELNLVDCVELRGFVADEALRAWYGAADLFVLPSMNDGWIFEGYGLVHMEASAAGLPVIGTYGCGVEDAIDNGVTGLLVSQENIDAELPQAIIRLLNDPNTRAAMGAAGKHRAQQHTWAKVAQAMIKLYEGSL